MCALVEQSVQQRHTHTYSGAAAAAALLSIFNRQLPLRTAAAAAAPKQCTFELILLSELMPFVNDSGQCPARLSLSLLPFFARYLLHTTAAN